jgi:hypothetical protein
MTMARTSTNGSANGNGGGSGQPASEVLWVGDDGTIEVDEPHSRGQAAAAPQQGAARPRTRLKPEEFGAVPRC